MRYKDELPNVRVKLVTAYVKGVSSLISLQYLWRSLGPVNLPVHKSGRKTSSSSMLVGFVVRGESPGCRLISTASMLEWLRNSSPTTHRGAVRKDGAEIP